MSKLYPTESRNPLCAGLTTLILRLFVAPSRAARKLSITALALAVLMAIPMTSKAQYSETFSTPNKGYLTNCTNDITSINWTLTPWDPTGTCRIDPPDPVTDLRDPLDYFSTTAAGVLECIDTDQEVCWESPLMNIGTAGTVSLSVALTWAGFDIDATGNPCIGDYIKVMYSVNGGSYTMVPNVVGGNPCATVAYPITAMGAPFNSSTTVTQGGITGTTLKIRVCVSTNANAELVTIDNVSVPQAGVSTGCAAPILSTVVTQVGCSNPNSGAINLSVSGGTPGYTYDWSNDGPDPVDNDPQDLSGLPVGTYTVTVTDAASCLATTSVMVTNAPALALTTQVLNANCGGTMDGEIGLAVSGGVPGYTYDWSNDGPETPDNDAKDLIGVGTGTYTVTVTDASGCSANTNATVGILPTSAYLEQFNVANKGYLANFVDDFAAVNWTMSSWSPQPPTPIGRDNVDFFRTSAGVLRGEDFDQEICWTSPLIDLNTGTQFSVDLAWTGFDVQVDEYINVKYSIDGGAYITLPNLVGSGAGTVQYTSGLEQNGSVTATKTGLSGNTIQIQVCGNFNSDAESMTIDNVSVPGSTTYCPVPEISLTPTNVTCVGGSSGNNGSIQVTASSGVPGYNVSWSGPSSGNPAGTEIAASGGSYNITSLAPGTYNVTVTGANGITATASVTLTLAPVFSIGDRVYNDVNRNGIFDGGDTGINGVALNLYRDVNSNNMLDAGDGSAVGSTTTANISGQDGRYAFNNVCPSTYIVQVAPSNFSMGGALYNMGVPFVSSPLSGAGDPDVDLDDNDDNGDPVSGFGVATAAFTISANNNNIDFGFKTPTTIFIDNATQVEGTGGSTSAFTVVITRTDIVDNITLTVNTVAGTASSPSDYTALVNQPISFTAGGATTAIVTVFVNHDNVVEANETFDVVISGAPPHGNITDNTALVTITNDDAATVTLSAPVSQLEGNAGNTQYVFTATLNNPVQNGFMIPYTIASGTAMFADLDMAGPNSSLTFAGTAGEVKTISVQINGDAKVELDETFTVTLGAPTVSGVTTSGSPATGTITNDDQATVTISNVSQNEGNAGPSNFNFTITLTGVVDVPVTFSAGTVDGSATVANNDYNLTVGGLTFPANGPATQVEGAAIAVQGDMTFESNETFLLRLSSLAASGRNVVFSPGGATLDGTGTILNDDLPPIIINEVDADQTGTDAAEFVELYDGGVGNTSLNGLVLVFYNGSNDLSYRAIDLDGFTTDANGYFLAGNTGVAGVGVTFPNDILQNGQDAVALYTANATDFPTNTPVTTTNLIDAVAYDTDDADDPGLLVLLNAGQPQVNENGGGNGTCHSIQRIPNGSGGPRNTNTYQALPPTPKAANFVPEVTISVSPASVLEDGATDLTYTITRTGNTACDLIVSFIGGGIASVGTDFPTFGASPIVIPAGSATATIVVNPNTDNVVETDETVIITLTDGALYDLGTSSAATGTITNDDAATVTLTGTTSQNEGTSFTFTATLDNPVQGGFSVTYATNNGTANTADNDYTDNDGSFSFAGTANEVKTITVNTTADNKVELNETFTVTLGSITLAPAGISAVGSPQTGTINNDDAANVSIAANVSQSEAITPQTFTVTLSNPVDVNVTVQFNTANNTATTGDNDYTGIVNQVITFNTGTTTAQTVNVAVTNDNKVEANEIYDVSIGTLAADGRNVALGTSNRTGTITNDDAATVTLSGGGSANEGNSGTTPRLFTATLNNPVQGGFTIPHTTNDGTATTADNDYQDNDGALAFAGLAGEIKTITVLVNGDSKVEANETYTVQLGAITGAPAGVSISGANPQTGTIFNDEIDWGDGPDSLPTLSFYGGARHNTLFGFQLGAAIDGDPEGQPSLLANGDDTDADGDDDDGVTLPGVFVTGTMATITVNASQAGKLDAFMDFNWNRNLSDAGEKIFNNVSLNPGDNTLSFLVPANAVVNASFMRFRFSSAGSLSNGGLAADGEVEDYKVSIVSNSYSISSPMVTEGDAGTVNLTYTISRTANANAGSVGYSAPTGTATSGTDYQAFAAGTVNFAAGGAMSQDITITVNGDMVVEDNETVIISLNNPVGGGIGMGIGTGTITNDDAATLTLTGGATQNEGNAGTVSYSFTATLNKAVQGGFQVAHTTGAGTATAGTDYVDNDGALTFSGNIGEAKSWTVEVNGDNTVELNETFEGALGVITMTSATQIAAISKLGSPQTSTITNDDAATVSIAANVSQAENLTPQVFTVTLSNPVDANVTVQFNTANNTATTGDNDYTGIVNQTVTFNAGTTTSQTVNVAVTNDNKVEATENFDVSIGTLAAGGRMVSLGTTNRTGTITNDDAATVTLTPASILMQNEGNTGTTPFVFTATLNNPVQGGFTLPYTTSDLLATTANNDYQDNDGTLTFAGTMGEAFNITVLVNGDFIVEANEGFNVALGAITGAPAGVTVVGSPQSGLIVNDEIDFGDAPDSYGTLLAGNGARHGTSLIVRLGATSDGDPDGQPGALADGDDTDPEGDDDDGVTLPSALVINTTANISIEASINGFVNGWVDFNQNGNFNEPGELVFNQQAVVAGINALSFAVPAGATVGASYARFRFTQGAVPALPTGLQTTGEVEDYAVNIVNTQFSINDPIAINEGNMGTTDLIFTVTRSTTLNACSVEYAITGGSASLGDADFTLITPSPISFTAGGSPTASVIIRVNGDTKVELNETVEVSLSNPVNGSILDGLGVGTINNDDSAILSITNPTVTEGDAGTQNMIFDLNLSSPSDTNVAVNFATMNGSATLADLDFQNNSGSHIFLPGQTAKQVVVLINGDCKIEPNETFAVRLSNLSSYGRNVGFPGGSSTTDGTGTINNNDAPPVITCPPPTTISCDASQLPANTGMATATDNCGPISFGYTDAITTGSCAGNYTIARTWKATDNTGDMSTCVQTITVVDNTAPTPVCLTNTVFIGAGGSYTLLASDVLNMNATTDNCGTVSVVSITPSILTCAQLNQTINVVVVVADDCGNSAQCTASITVDEDTDLPSGWSFGNVANANGSSVFSPCAGENGAFVLTATGFSTSSSDVLHTAYQQICGNTTVTARIVSVSGSGWGGVMIRENLMPGSKKVGMKTQLTTNIRREIRSVTNGPAAILNYIRPGHTWLRLERSGSNFAGYSSPDGVSWNFAFAATVSMTGCVYVGIFSESINNAVVNTATFDNVIVTGTPLLLAGNFNPLPVAESGDEVQIYPNPTTGELNIDLDVHTGKPGVIQVFNVLGELVIQERLVAGNMETHNMRIEGSAGVYTVVVQLDEHRIVRRVVVDPN